MADQHFHVTGNMPGYLSNDDDPATFVDFWSALEALADELERQADDLYDRTGMFGTEGLDPDTYADLQQTNAALEAEGDRIHAVAAAIRKTLGIHERGLYEPKDLDLGPDDRWPLSMARNGIVVHVDTDPTSDTHLGWNVHLSPCVEDCPDPDCNTCGGTGRWESTIEDAPTTLIDLGECPDCWKG